MAEGEGLLSRWSRLKRAAETVEPASLPTEHETPALPAVEVEESVDLATLPPVDSLCADSDYTAFLRRGVPEAVRRVALRRAWATDPAIAGFRGFAEYDWDCNAPGYGALRACDDLAKLCDAILRPPPEPAVEVPQPEAGPAPAEPPAPAERINDEAKVA